MALHQYEDSESNEQFMKHCKRRYFYGSTATGGFHKLSYFECGNINSAHKILCVHGLTRNALDFVPFCNAFVTAKHCQAHILCLDVVGRGQSDRLTNAMDYNYDQYIRDCTTWIAHIMGRYSERNASRNHDYTNLRITWIGTSMGGLIGMFLAAMKQTLIHQLVINDVGPYIASSFMDRIAPYIGQNPPMKNMDEVLKTLKSRYQEPFGAMMSTERDWMFYARNSCYFDEKVKGYKLAYDERIYEFLKSAADENGKWPDVDLFPVFNMIDQDKVDVLVLQGKESDILTNDVVDKMRKANNKLQVLVVPEVGHHPQLRTKLEIDTIYEFSCKQRLKSRL